MCQFVPALQVATVKVYKIVQDYIDLIWFDVEQCHVPEASLRNFWLKWIAFTLLSLAAIGSESFNTWWWKRLYFQEHAKENSIQKWRWLNQGWGPAALVKKHILSSQWILGCILQNQFMESWSKKVVIVVSVLCRCFGDIWRYDCNLCNRFYNSNSHREQQLCTASQLLFPRGGGASSPAAVATRTMAVPWYMRIWS